MSIIKQFDTIGFYYTFEYYLYEQELDCTILEYLQNNNVNIGSLICFFDIIKNDTRYVIATDQENSYKVISIIKSNINDNFISGNLIFYGGYKFNILDNINLADAETYIKITTHDVTEYKKSHFNHFSNDITIKNIDKLGGMYICRAVSSLRPISVLVNYGLVYVSKYGINHITESEIKKLNMDKLFPNLQGIIDCKNKIIYKKKIKN
jgi:hypothetical protein